MFNRRVMLFLGLLTFLTPAVRADESVPTTRPAVLPGVTRILFLGDSITYGGSYIDLVELHLRTHLPSRNFEILGLGIPSETVEGLTEEGHPFPRPDLHERLDRTMKMLAEKGWKPDLVLASYGMNDGIYKPVEETRFRAYRDGMQKLADRMKADGIPLTFLTPTPFDPRPTDGKRAKAKQDGKEFIGPSGDYDHTLAVYSDWLLSQRKSAGWDVVDLHAPLKDAELAARQLDPKFALAGDGVHPGEFGHWLMARQILRHWRLYPEDTYPASGPKASTPTTAPSSDAGLLKIISQRRRMLGDAWLNHIGHKRPGMAKGLPIDEAITKAAAVDAQIHAAVAPVIPAVGQ